VLADRKAWRLSAGYLEAVPCSRPNVPRRLFRALVRARETAHSGSGRLLFDPGDSDQTTAMATGGSSVRLASLSGRARTPRGAESSNPSRWVKERLAGGWVRGDQRRVAAGIIGVGRSWTAWMISASGANPRAAGVLQRRRARELVFGDRDCHAALMNHRVNLGEKLRPVDQSDRSGIVGHLNAYELMVVEVRGELSRTGTATPTISSSSCRGA
jgi:hypothetical protein